MNKLKIGVITIYTIVVYAIVIDYILGATIKPDIFIQVTASLIIQAVVGVSIIVLDVFNRETQSSLVRRMTYLYIIWTVVDLLSISTRLVGKHYIDLQLGVTLLLLVPYIVSYKSRVKLKETEENILKLDIDKRKD